MKHQFSLSYIIASHQEDRTYLDQAAMENKSAITLGVTTLLLIAALTCVVLVYYQPEKVSFILFSRFNDGVELYHPPIMNIASS